MIIHYRKEGYSGKSGLGITVGTPFWRWPWISFVWTSFDPNTYIVSGWYLRFRTFCSPHIIWNTFNYNIVDQFCIERGYSLVSKEEFEDYVIDGRARTQKSKELAEENNRKLREAWKLRQALPQN